MTLLDCKLDPKQEQSISMHAVIGYRFNRIWTIDEKWIKSNIELIFTHDPQHANAGDASWDALPHQIYENAFYVLVDEYKYRIRQTKEKSSESVVYKVQKALVQQIGLFYINNLKYSDDLFKLVLSQSDPLLLDDCLEWIGMALKNRKK